MKQNDFLPSINDLELLFVNNEDLTKIITSLGRFNPIQVMRMENQEIRHSNILAWLLNPKESHGLDDKFLKAFLAEAFRGVSNPLPSALDVSQSDLRDAEVRLEWQKIDILILSKTNNWAFIIENKINSKQHTDQLNRYNAKVKSAFQADAGYIKMRGILLSLYEEEPEGEGYVRIGYEVICEILARIILSFSKLLKNEVEIFLRHYVEIIKDACNMNDETDQMKDLARKLYQQHSQVLNFIWEHGADSEFRTAVEVVTGKDKKFPNEFVGGAESGDPTYIYCKCNDRRFSFIPKSWYAALGNDGFTWPGCERWWAGYPVICWIEIYKSTGGKKGELRIFAEIGPISVLEFRKQLIHKIKESAQKNNDDNIKFNQGADKDSSKYSKFFKNGILHISDVHDQEEIANGIKTLMKKFKPSFDSVGSVLPEFLENGNPTTSDAV